MSLLIGIPKETFAGEKRVATVPEVVAKLVKLGFARWDEEVRHEALQWSRMRGARSGRVAWQFAKDWSGAHAPRSARRRK